MARVSSLKGVLAAAGVVGLGSAIFCAAPAKANAVLFTTSSDFTGWQASAVTPTASTAFDSDGSTTNGIGNDTAGPGTSPGGSMLIPADGRTSVGYATLAFDPNGEAYNLAFMHTIDPGSLAAYTAESGYGGGSTTAYSGTMYVTYTIPTFTGPATGAYFQVGINLSYAADGYYDPAFGTTINTQTIGGLTTLTDAIPYTITAGSGNLSGFGFGLQMNTNETGKSAFYIDDIEVAVPEPASASLLGLAGVSLLGRRRRK